MRLIPFTSVPFTSAACAIAAAAMLAGCTTMAEYSLKDSLADIGFSQNQANCMAEQLRDRLDDKELRELASHVSRLSRADDSGEALSALKRINNPGVIAAVTASGFSCALAPNR